MFIATHLPDTSNIENANAKDILLETDKLEPINENVSMVLNSCMLMKYLVSKAMNTGYLTHFERLSILHVFGHLGESGKEFVHKVMEFTLNYKYSVTQRFIDKLPDKPISCIKLREQYKMISAEFGCNCMFKHIKDCYPSPVIHALKNNSEVDRNITIPLSRTITKAKQEGVYDELNIHIRVQEMAVKLVELKKQKRGIDKTVQKLQEDLCKVFDSAGVECMEIDIGILSRKKTSAGYEWVIEI